MGTLDLLFGGGGDILFGYSIFMFCYCCFGFVVLVLVVYSIFNCFTNWVCFVFSIACSCRWCLGLV